MMTEDEARTKWCPFARVAMYVRGDAPDLEKPVDLVGHGANRMVTDDPKLTASIQTAIDGIGGTKCIASKCMAWRWESERDEALETIEWRGYCGLAGKD